MCYATVNEQYAFLFQNFYDNKWAVSGVGVGYNGVNTALPYARNPFTSHPRMSFIFDSSRAISRRHIQ